MTRLQSTSKTTVIALVFIVAVSLYPRLYKITSPIMVFHSWRQCDTAAITRNIFRSGFDVFHPQVDYRGNEPSTVECEFQIYGLITSLLYLFFGVNETVGRLVSVCFYCATTIPLAWLGFKLWGDGGAFWTIVFFGLSPISVIMSRSFQPDSTMVFFLVTSVALFWKYLDSIEKPSPKAYLPDRKYLMWLTGACLALALLSKLVAVYIGIAFLGLVLSFRGLTGLKEKNIWTIALTGLIPSFVWYGYASTFPVSFNIWGLGPQNLSNWTGWMSSEYYNAFLSHFVTLSCTEICFALAIAGFLAIARYEKGTKRNLPLAWLTGAILYQILTSRHFIAHSYYYYPVLPIFFLGASWIPARLWKKYGLKATVPFILLIGYFGGTQSFELLYPQMYTIGDQPARMLKLANLIKKNTEKEDLIVTAVGHGLPEVLYYSDRRGWHIPYKKATMEHLGKLKKKGATHFGWLQPNLPRFMPSPDVKISMWALVDFILRNELDVNYALGDGYGFYMLIDLRKKFSARLKDSDNIFAQMGTIVNRTIVTGEGIDALTSVTGINSFILPWPDLLSNTYKLTHVLSQRSEWKLIHFTDHGMVFVKPDNSNREKILNLAYNYLDPLSKYGNFCIEEKMDTLLLQKTLEEAQRAHKTAPKSFRAATMYGSLLGINGQYGKAALVFNTPWFKKTFPEQSRTNHLVCAINLNDQPQVTKLVTEILSKWPENRLALAMKEKYNIRIDK